MKLWSIEGNTQKLDGGSMFGNAPRAMWTQWATPDGQAHFRRDLYNRDGVGATATAY